MYSTQSRKSLMSFITINLLSMSCIARLNSFILKASTLSTHLAYNQRAELAINPIAQRLFSIIEHKQSNLVVAADVTTKAELLALADQVGPEICILKTHIDIISDFDWDLVVQLQALAQKHNFLICEDRKFADIGNTVRSQYAGGIYRIAEWADIIIAHGIMGPEIVASLGTQKNKKPCGILLLAQASSAHNLISDAYSQGIIEIALKHPESVIGVITQGVCVPDARFVNATPGVNLSTSRDALDQQYNSPEYVIKHKGTDLIIVGRGIYQDKNPRMAAQKYRASGWKAYQELIEK